MLYFSFSINIIVSYLLFVIILFFIKHENYLLLCKKKAQKLDTCDSNPNSVILGEFS